MLYCGGWFADHQCICWCKKMEACVNMVEITKVAEWGEGWVNDFWFT